MVVSLIAVLVYESKVDARPTAAMLNAQQEARSDLPYFAVGLGEKDSARFCFR
jgi:hypothetical protein